MNRKELIGALATKTGDTKAVADRNIAAASKAPAFKAGATLKTAVNCSKK